MGLEVLAAAAIIGTVGSIYSSNQASKATKKASQAQRKQETLRAAVERRREIKNARFANAMAVQAGENQGVAESSGALGGQGSIQSQLSSNLSFLDRQESLADYAGSMFDKAAKWNQTAANFQGAAELAQVGYGMEQNRQQAEAYKKMFG